MCIAAIAWEAHPRWRLVIAANRDEVHDRPTAPLRRWQEKGGIIAGRDLRSGGTWLGLTDAPAGDKTPGDPEARGEASGRCVLITNYRAPGFPIADRPSRGGLVTELLDGADPATIDIAPYNPFNLFVAEAGAAWLLCNQPAERRQPVVPGILGLSNGDFAKPWPKTRQLCAALENWLAAGDASPAALFTALASEAPRLAAGGQWQPEDDDPEPRLAPVFIRDPDYGTRSSTVVLVDREGAGLIVERRFGPDGRRDGPGTGETAIRLRWA